MRYLLVLYFAGFFLADAALIKKYKLRLEPKENEFQGKVTLTLSDTNNNHEVELNPYYTEVTECTYVGLDVPTNPLPDSTTKTPADEPLADEPPSPREQICTVEDNKIKFYGERTTEEVIIEFKGNYRMTGLAKYTTQSNDRLYVADMTAENHAMIFPCQENVKAQFEFEGDDVVMSNLENLREKDEEKRVFLRDLIFFQGDIVEDGKTAKSLPYYRMKSSKRMGQKLEKIMERVAELDPSLKLLFTPVSNEIRITSRDVIIFSDAELKPDDSESDYSHIIQILVGKFFQRPEEERKTFFDIVGPKFVEMKISGATDFLPKGHQQFLKIHALKEDGFSNSMSLNELVSKNEDNRKNPVVYAKGISVLYSLESICGNEKFTKGLSNYIRYGKKVNEAFEGCFDSKDNAREFFKLWTDDPGYPVVHVILSKPAQYVMNQERFLWSGSEQKDQRWIIRTDYKTKEGSTKNITLPATKNTVTETINSTYFILDHNNIGFYRVNYDAKSWEALISQLKSNPAAIDPVARIKLIDDIFSFPKSTYTFTHGIPDYVTALKLSEYLRNETDSVTLYVAFNALSFLDSALGSSYHGKFRDHMKGILNAVYSNIKKVEDPVVQNQLILLACKFGVEECTKNAATTFSEINLDTTELSVLQKLAICSVVRNNSTKWMDSFALLSAMGIRSSEKMFSLACSRDEKILSLFLTQFITPKDEEGFKQAVTYAMEQNPDNIKVILNIIKRFEGAITKAFGKKVLQEIVQQALPKLNMESADTLKEIAKNLDGSVKEDVKKVCENVKLWTEKKAKSVGDYFKGSGGGTGGGSQAKPIALVLLVTTFLPLANHIFHS